MERPTWWLGLQFIDRQRRRFEVRHTIYGELESPLRYTVETSNGWMITSQIGGEYPQTHIGFVELANSEATLTYQSVEDMDDFVRNGHLIKL